MALDQYRSLLALRYAAESIDEVNVFMARTLEIQLRQRKQSAWDRIVVYFGGVAASVAAAFSIGEEFFEPALILAGFLLLVLGKAVFNLKAIEDQRRELTLDHRTIQEYLRRATRDRKENRVSVAIQNLHAAKGLLDSDAELTVKDRAFLENHAEHWRQRIDEDRKQMLEDENSKVWTENREMWGRIMGWIDHELGTVSGEGSDAGSAKAGDDAV